MTLLWIIFSGRGTTALVCRELNRKFIGNDLNPYSYVLSKLKVLKISKNSIIRRINNMEKEFNSSIYSNINVLKNYKNLNELKIFYSNKTLRQLIFIREQYGKKWRYLSSSNIAVVSFALGLMHGPMKYNGETIYFSLSMPNTISMAPNYVKNYSKKNNLKKPNVNVFSKIKDRVEKKYDEILNKDYDGKIYYSDSTIFNKNIKDNSISLVISSPPYMNIVNYTTSNWLKLWLLGFERINLKYEIKLSDNLKFKEYCEFIKKYLKNIYKKLKKMQKFAL